MNTSSSTSTNPQTSQLIPVSSSTIENPSAWIRDGYSPTEIILAIAFLSSLLMGGAATLIMAITGLVKTLAPVRNQTKSSSAKAKN
ncbi:hypothetical protein H6G74_16160 [Nostoc spongiaeforme FACHB-130]|uniref:Uncharacterized protein n=2 Tax=Nostoc TaxID=1177 RepID=A0ABR8FWP0_9NOSO|nr:hypothetical protein [Nostoc spongiaeforme FACHB-130]